MSWKMYCWMYLLSVFNFYFFLKSLMAGVYFISAISFVAFISIIMTAWRITNDDRIF